MADSSSVRGSIETNYAEPIFFFASAVRSHCDTGISSIAKPTPSRSSAVIIDLPS